jgi:hypothetical protein
MYKMTATNPFWWLLIAAAIAAAIAIPMTNHAQQTHLGEKWSTVAIQNVVLNGQCQPIYTWACPQNILKIACPYKPGSDLWIGLIVGGKKPVVGLWESLAGGQPAACNDLICITGFAARASYWRQSAARDGCTEVVLP